MHTITEPYTRDPLSRSIVRAVLEVLGSDAPVLGETGLELMPVCRDLEDRFGPFPGRGLALRIGRAFASALAPQFMPTAPAMPEQARFLPVRKKIRAGLERLGDLVEPFVGESQLSILEPDSLWWLLDPCLVCATRSEPQAICHFVVGMLSESMSLLGGGRSYCVQEIECVAQGGSRCIFSLALVPTE